MTYGGSGSNRDTAVELINPPLLEITLRPLAHLTCVGNTTQELADIVGKPLELGVRGFLALRGDLEGPVSVALSTNVCPVSGVSGLP